jgi:uncharacterized protein
LTHFLRFSKDLFAGLLLSAGFLALDGAWLELLPRLGISYGRVLPTLTVFAILRAGLFIAWLLILVGLAVFRAGARQRNAIRILAALNFLILGIALYGFYIEPQQLTVGRIQVPLPGLSHPVRIVQLSDIHVERNTHREQVLPGLVESLHPDMIVLTGDYLNLSYLHDDRAAGDLRQLLGQLHAPLGIYAVNGTVEHSQEMESYLAGLDIHPLEDEVVRIPAFGDHFVMLGVNDVEFNYDQARLKLLMQQVKLDDFSLLLYHKPDLAYVARDLGVNLYLAGHTHGGQIRLPFYGAMVTNSHYGKTFEMGLYHLDQTTLYVSRGLGLEGGSAPRARFLCPPEVVVVDLVPASNQ